MRFPIRVDNYSRIEKIVGIGQALQLAHDLVGVAAPFGFNKWSHVASRTVFGLQRSIVTVHHDFDHVVDEARVLIDRGLIVETLGDHKVQVAVFSVAEDDGIGIAVLTKQAVEIVCRMGQAFDRKRDVFDNHGRTALAHRADGRKHSCADLPEQCLFGGNMGEACRLEQLQSADRIPGQRFQLGTILLFGGLEFDQ